MKRHSDWSRECMSMDGGGEGQSGDGVGPVDYSEDSGLDSRLTGKMLEDFEQRSNML